MGGVEEKFVYVIYKSIIRCCNWVLNSCCQSVVDNDVSSFSSIVAAVIIGIYFTTLFQILKYTDTSKYQLNSLYIH